MRNNEHLIQSAFIQWVDMNISRPNHHPAFDYIFAVPNGGKRGFKTAATMKREGQRKGVLDLWCPYPSGRFFGWICETKAGKNKPTKEQAEWLDRMVDVRWFCCVCRSTDAMIDSFEKYIGIRKAKD